MYKLSVESTQGVCRQIGDYQKAHAFAYNILKEGEFTATYFIIFIRYAHSACFFIVLYPF